MPSVFTIEGTDVGAPKETPKIGFCKPVKNSRTGCTMQLCYVGKAASRTGWKFKKGSSVCTRR